MNNSRRPNTGRGRKKAPPKGGASEALRYVTDQTRTVALQAKEGAVEMSRALLETVRDQAEQVYDRHKSRAVSRVGALGKVANRTAHALHALKAGDAARYMEQASERVTRASQYLDEQPVGAMLEDAGALLRRNGTVAAGGLFLLGFAAVRFLKATEARGEPAAGAGRPNRRRPRQARSRKRG